MAKIAIKEYAQGQTTLFNFDYLLKLIVSASQ